MKRKDRTLWLTFASLDLAEMRDRKQVPSPPWERKEGEEDEGPRRPKVNRPNTRELLKRMRRVDPNQSRRYRQRTGE